jgi:glycosyltransferase involved in cell wall biosynthesis
MALGSVPHDVVMAAWNRAALGFVPSLFPDPCPTVAMEAMAAGVPLIASRIGGLPEIVSAGDTGLLVEAGNAAQLRTAMLSFFSDPGLGKRMGITARQRVNVFTQSVVSDQIEAIYARAVDRHGSPAGPC